MGAIDQLCALLRGRRLAVLTGAGCSTESGIPDYRGPGTARRARNPIRFQDFVRDAAGRQRYWARSFVGWPRVDGARPNPAHRALSALERGGLLTGLITQNVDRLHQRAGHRRVVELHGALAEVRCLACGAREARSRLQERLAVANPGFGRRAASLAPDGDADLDATEGFVVASCQVCAGELKPDVVFFGESVPRERVEAAQAIVAEAEALLVVGSSLTVFSGYRFARQAASAGLPIAAVNLGPTRADPLLRCKVEAAAGEALPELVSALLPPDPLLRRSRGD